MMRYGYFDSEITGVDPEGMPIFDRAETSELFRLLFSKLLTNGVLAKPSDCFQVLAGDSGLTVKVRPGFGMINGAFAYDAAEAAYELETAPAQNRRIDRIVLRCNYLDRLCEIIVKTGTAASNPAAPELVRPVSGDYYELSLALVTVNANQSVLTQSSITDTRADSSVCGFITQFINSIDTEVFFAQLNAFYAEFTAKSNASYAEFERMAQEAYAGYTTAIDAYIAALEEQGNASLTAITEDLKEFQEKSQNEITTWFEGVQDLLEGDVAVKLASDVEVLKAGKQDKLSGTQGQIVGFDGEGKAVAQAPPDTGVTSFHGRKGEVVPQEGDYSAEDVGARPNNWMPTAAEVGARPNSWMPTAAEVGAVPVTGGTVNGNIAITGNLILKGSGNYGNKINLGDGDYVHISEPTDDCMEIKAKKINFVISDTTDSRFTLNNNPLPTSVAAVGKSLAHQNVYIKKDTYMTAENGAEIFNDYRERTFDADGNVLAGNVAAGDYSHAEGCGTTAEGRKSHAEGYQTSTYGQGAHAEGYQTSASDLGSHAEGYQTSANGNNAHAEGNSTTASGDRSHAGGYQTIAAGDNQTAIGKFNLASTSETDRLIIGKGTATSARANCFRVTDTGVYATGAHNTTGADYAEYFEWLDGNLENADRMGLFVTLEGEKIRPARAKDDFILGIVSAAPSVCGDVHDDQWQGMYLYDIYGRPLWEDVEVPDENIEEPDPENPGGTITRILIPAHTEHRQKLNPDYDNAQPYVPRSERPEWDAVGMLGKLVARDDGTCKVNGWCAVGENGIATESGARTKYRVMARLDENHIRVLII